jgi:hypothetical protein
MLAVGHTNLQIYNVAGKRVRRRTYSIKSCEKDVIIKQLREENEKYKNAHKKIKMFTKWNKRSNTSSMNDIDSIISVIEELYGDSAFEK